MPLERRVVPLRDRRQQVASSLEAVQQVLSVLMLLMAIQDRLRTPGPGDVPLALAQAAASVLLLTAVARELRGHAAGRVSWSNLLAGALLGLEWFDRYKHGGKIVSPILLTAIVSVVVGLLHRRIHNRRDGRRRILLDDEALDYRYAFRHFRVPWADLREIVTEESAVRLLTRGGRSHTIRVGRLNNGSEVSGVVVAHASAAGVPVRFSRTALAAGEGVPHTGEFHDDQ